MRTLDTAPTLHCDETEIYSGSRPACVHIEEEEFPNNGPFLSSCIILRDPTESDRMAKCRLSFGKGSNPTLR